MKRRLGKVAAAFLVLVLATGAATRVQAQTLTVLYSFTGGSDGRGPGAALILDAAGNLYSTTFSGGVSGFGTVFKLDPSGNETVLHNFTNSPDGAFPDAGLVMDAAGNLYGTTGSGGASNAGTVFKLDPSGNETVLYS